MEYVFFSVNDFSREGGGTIRMYGILNELAKRGNKITFVSNALNFEKFDSTIAHVHLNHQFSRVEKRIFQGLLALLPLFIVSLFYRRLLNNVKNIKSNFLNVNEVFFFEYLDNSIGYFLKKNGLIPGYVNDLHGVATLEFDFQFRNTKSFGGKIKFYIKYVFAEALDKKVFENAERLIFASNAMKALFEKKYRLLSAEENYVLPYLLSTDALSNKVDMALREKLIHKLGIGDQERTILFAGAFKMTGGVPDLIRAFQKIAQNEKNCRLFLIGDGPTYKECVAIALKEATDRIVFLGRTKYDELTTYQDLADILICPDKQNVYSELIIHVKYLDALLADKIVINGNFSSVLEVNQNESLSIGFEPSNIESLAYAIEYSLSNLKELENKYQNNSNFVKTQLTYKSQIKVLEKTYHID